MWTLQIIFENCQYLKEKKISAKLAKLNAYNCEKKEQKTKKKK